MHAGFITQDQARKRREEVTGEADFYGSMDGATKFVKGDAIAGIVILVINLIGGLFIGMLQHDLPFAQAMEIYTLLTIGDGLVAQIPGLLLSIGTAIIVTRQNKESNMGEQISLQLGNLRVLTMAASLLGIMGLVPGMPHLAFLSLAGVLGGTAYYMHRREQQKPAEIAPRSSDLAAPAESSNHKEISWDDVQPVDVIGLEIGRAHV